MIIKLKCFFFQNRSKKRKGFTLIEIIIVLIITSVLALVAMPAVFDAVVRIEEDSTIESAAVGLNQFFIDARSKSIRDESRYELYKKDDFALSFKNSDDASLTINYSLPEGMRTKLELSFPDNNASYSYIMGLFCEEKNSYFEISDEFYLNILTKEATVATLTVSSGLSEVEY